MKTKFLVFFILVFGFILLGFSQQRGTGFFSAAASSGYPLPSVDSQCVFWVAADQISGLTDGAAVSTWNDLTTNANNCSSSSTERPVYKANIINGFPVVRFDGVNDLMTVADAANLRCTNLTMIAVVTFRGGGTGSGAICMKNATASSGTAPYVFYQGSQQSAKTLSAGVSTGGSFFQANGSGMTDGTFYYVSFTYDGTTRRVYRNSVFDGSDSSSTGNIASTTGTVQIGGYNASFSSGEWGNVDIAEIMLFTGATNLTDRAFYENYLKTKYGL